MYNMLTEIFLSFLVTSGIGAILVVCRLLYKSKCKNFELCCVKIERDGEQENNADLIVDMARRMSTSNPLDKEPIIRYENIYKGDLKKNEKKIQDLPSLEKGVNVTLS